jgi:hypothetical protein
MINLNQPSFQDSDKESIFHKIIQNSQDNEVERTAVIEILTANSKAEDQVQVVELERLNKLYSKSDSERSLYFYDTFRVGVM